MNIKSESVAGQVLDSLRNAGHAALAEELESWLHQLESPAPAKRREALTKVQERCHPRWLGDVFIPELDLNQWLGLLNDLREAAGKPNPLGVGAALREASVPDQGKVPDARVAVRALQTETGYPEDVCWEIWVGAGRNLTRAKKMASKPPYAAGAGQQPHGAVRRLARKDRGSSATELVARLDSWLKKNRPAYYRSLVPGLPPEAITVLEARLGLELPQAFKDLYGWRNGADLESFQSRYQLMNSSSIVDQRSVMMDLLKAGEDTNWSPGWIPFLSDGGGDFVCLDLGFSLNQRGQVVEYAHDDVRQTVAYKSFFKWLETHVLSLEGGLWVADSEGDLKPRDHSKWHALLKKNNPGYPVIISPPQPR